MPQSKIQLFYYGDKSCKMLIMTEPFSLAEMLFPLRVIMGLKFISCSI